MKKVIGLMLVLALGLSFMGCGAKSDSGSGAADNKATAASQDKDAKDNGGNAAAEVGFNLGDNGDMYVFKVSSKLSLEQDAWLGIVPSGEYTKEADADEVDIYYVYQAAPEENAGNDYVFEYPKIDVKESIEDGNYTMVLCNTDADTGKVLFYLPVTIKGDSLKLDLDKLKVNK